MAGSNRDVKQLIRLRQGRPSFARMISWEFSKCSEDERPRNKKKRKQTSYEMQRVSKSGDSETDAPAPVTEEGKAPDDEGSHTSESSEESEYDTAPEDEITDLCDTFGDSISTTDTFQSVYNDSTEQIAENADCLSKQSSSEDDGGDDDDDAPILGKNVSNIDTRVRKRSKKQKKKRAELNRLIFANEFMNLMNVFDVEDEVDDVFEEKIGNPKALEVNRRVPSLVELCMKASRQKSRSRHNSSNLASSASSMELPYGIKRLLTTLRHDQRMLSKQLAYLQNHILPIIGTKDGIQKLTHKGKFKLQLRSVWTNLPHLLSDGDIMDFTLQSTKWPMFLYTPTWRQPAIDGSTSTYNYCFKLYDLTISTCALSAFAVTIDLMLPSVMRQTSFPIKECNEEMALSKSFQTMLMRVKIALKARYPLLVAVYFDFVIPYVMWARGNCAIATEMFRHLIKNEAKERRKAMYLSETARMLQQFGDEEGACRFYKMATEMAVTQRKISEKGIEEVTEQGQILLANVYDTGILDSNKAQLSASHWSSAMGLPKSRSDTIIAGVESFLCYHAAHCEDWLATALSKIDKYSSKVSTLLLHQSLVQALMGSESDSRRSFREFRMSNGGIGTTVLSFLGDRERNPWRPLVEAIQTQKLAQIKPLNVVWRTCLLPTCLANIRQCEAHITSPALNLRINESGHLTGDLQMLLPPQRDVTLDPYTGFLVINNCPSFVGEWHSAYFDPELYYSDKMLLPTPTLISAHEDGTTVHLLYCGPRAIRSYLDSEIKWTTMVLYWTGPKGQVAKVNLARELKDYIYKCRENDIKSTGEKNAKGLLSIEEHMLNVLDEAYKGNLLMDYHTLNSVAKRRQNEDRRKLNSNKSQKKKKKYRKPYLHTDSIDFILQEPPLTFGKTVVLRIRAGNLFKKEDKLVFVRSYDKAQFQAIKILPIDACSAIVKDFYMKDEEFLCVKDMNRFSLYNEFGVLVEGLDVKELGKADNMGTDCSPCIVGPCIYGMNRDRTSIWKHMIGIEDEKTLEESVTWCIVPYMAELGQANMENEVTHVKTVGRSVTGKLLLLNCTFGLGFMDPITMEFVPMILLESLIDQNLTEDRKILIGQFNLVNILTETVFERDGFTVCRTVLAINNTVLVLELKRGSSSETPTVTLLYRTSLPGIAKEACLVGKDVGLLISVTMNDNEDQANYHEHVFFIDNHTQLQGILPFLARGPRSFHCVYLHGNSEQSEGQGLVSKAGWYAYMRDGKGGILGVKLTC